MVSGPPRYVTLVEQTLAGLVAEDQARPKPVARADAPKPPDVTTLTVLRGAQVTVIRDGRPERIIGPEPIPSQGPGLVAAEPGPAYGPGRGLAQQAAD